jgi:RNA-directed DNA polymerase
MLDDLDRELWTRGHRFVRYADLCRVRHKSAYAARRVMPSAVVEVLVSGGRGGRVLGIIRAV